MRYLGLALLVGALWVPAAALPGCDGDCHLGQKQFSFTIPVGSVIRVLDTLIKLMGGVGILPPGVGLLIPDITVTLHTEFFGYAWVKCDKECCPDGRLYMGAELLLEGKADFDSIPPLSSGFTAVIPVVHRLPDCYDPEDPCADPCDTDLDPCAISTTWSYTQENFQVTLSFPVVGKVVFIRLSDSRGEGFASCRTYWGCGDYETRPVLVSWPQEVVVPIGGEAHFAVVATMSSSSLPRLTLKGDLPYDRPLQYELSSSRWSGVRLAITSDRKEDGRIIPGGQGTIAVDEDAPIPDGATETIFITVEDPSTGRRDQRDMTVRYVRNRPPQAISDGMTISHGEGCFGPVRYAATDPDLPDFVLLPGGEG